MDLTILDDSRRPIREARLQPHASSKRVRSALLLSVVAAFANSSFPQSASLRELYRPSPHPGDEVYRYQFGDLDGDGLKDVFLQTQFPKFHAWKNAGGRFVDELPALPPEINQFARGSGVLLDVDADGDLDILAGRFGPTSSAAPKQLFLNDSQGSFQLAPASSVVEVPNYSIGLHSADVDGDGDEDVLAIGETRGPLAGGRIYYNLQNGTLAAVHTTVTGVGAANGPVRFGDVDLDGDLDLFTADEGFLSINDSLTGYLNDGVGQFTVLVTHSSELFLELADFDADGDPDLLTSQRLLLNDGTGLFSLSPSQPAALGNVESLDSGDVDGDGDIDVVFSRRASLPQRQLLLNDGSGGFLNGTSAIPQIPTAYGAVAFFDIDADGDLDILGSGSTELDVLRGDGNGAFSSDVRGTDVLRIGSSNPTRLLVGDLTGDGWPDVYGTGYSGHALAVGTGTGRFENGNSLLPPGSGPTAALGDLDGDGDLDVYSARIGVRDRLFWNAGNGDLTSTSSVSDASPSILRVAVRLGDLDGDGDLDAVTLGDTSPSSYHGAQIWRNDGSASWVQVPVNMPPSPIGVPSNLPRRIELGDFDGDGFLDMFMRGRVVLGDGVAGGTWSPGGAYGPRTPLDVADVDSDGDVDALLASTNASFVAENNNSVIQLRDLEPNATSLVDARFLDVDDDGIMEVYLMHHSSREDQLATYNGIDYSFETIPGTIQWGYGLAVGDFTQDKTPDVITHRSSPTRNGNSVAQVFSSTSRRLSWESAPSLGKPQFMRLEGDAFDAYLLAWSLQRVELALPPHGTLRISPLAFQIAELGVLGPSTTTLFSTPTPNDPLLAGLEVYWQALVGLPPAGLTNLEITQLENF